MLKKIQQKQNYWKCSVASTTQNWPHLKYFDMMLLFCIVLFKMMQKIDDIVIFDLIIGIGRIYTERVKIDIVSK